MLDRGGDDEVPDPTAPLHQAGHRRLGGRRQGTGEDDLVGTGADVGCDTFAGGVEGLRGQPARPVQPLGVAPARGRGKNPRVTCLWEQGFT